MEEKNNELLVRGYQEVEKLVYKIGRKIEEANKPANKLASTKIYVYDYKTK